MSDTQKRTRIYATVAAVSIGILALSVIGGLWTNVPDAPVVPTANGNESFGGISAERGITSAAALEKQIGNNDDNNSQFELFVTGTASKKLGADKVSVTLGVETQEKTAQEASRKNAELMNAVIDGLKELGLDTSQISTNFYNIHPVYEYEAVPIYEENLMPPRHTQKQVLVGYRVTNTITVTAPASANVGEIIDAAINGGANQVQGVHYFVSEEVQSQMNDELIGEAVLSAKTKAEKALAPLGMKIVGVKSLNLNDVYYPVHKFYDAAYEAQSMAAPTPILPSEQQVSASVSVTFLIAAR